MFKLIEDDMYNTVYVCMYVCIGDVMKMEGVFSQEEGLEWCSNFRFVNWGKTRQEHQVIKWYLRVI